MRRGRSGSGTRFGGTAREIDADANLKRGTDGERREGGRRGWRRGPPWRGAPDGLPSRRI